MAEARAESAASPGAISAVAHELQTPLAAVRGAAAALRREDLDETTRDRLLAVIEDAAGQLSQLVDGLLTAGRLEAGRLELDLLPVDVAAVAGAVVEAARAAAPGRAEVRLVTPAAAMPIARGDPARLRQALASLVDNAVRYGPPGSAVEVRAEAAGGTVRLAVTDRGPGIARADQERAFAPFVRLTSGTAGTGLGLYLARELVRAMGGELGLESEQGQGSTFTIDLPAAP